MRKLLGDFPQKVGEKREKEGEKREKDGEKREKSRRSSEVSRKNKALSRKEGQNSHGAIIFQSKTEHGIFHLKNLVKRVISCRFAAMNATP